MKVIRSSDRATKVQPPTNFTGTVFADEVVVGTKPSHMRATVVSFTPGGRTAWHSHPWVRPCIACPVPAACRKPASKCRKSAPATPL